MVAFLILLLFAVIFEGTCRAESLGGRCSRKRVARLMRKAALQGCIRGRRKRTTRRDKHATPAPELVKRNFAATAPNRLWTAEITYIHRPWEGFLYLAFIQDESTLGK